MFIRPLFSKFQKELVAFANTNYGRDFVSQFGGNELKEKYPIVKVAPDGIHQHLGGNTFRAVFYPRSPYVKHFAEVLTQVDIAKSNGYDTNKKELVIPHYLGETKLLDNELPTIYLASPETFNPEATPETYVDGYAGTIQDERTFAQIISDAGNIATDGATRLDIFMLTGTGTNLWDRSHRMIILFDTSSLPDSATKVSATYSLYEPNDGAFANNFGGALCLVQSTPASNTTLQNADYAQVGTTQQATDVNMSTIGANLAAYNDWTLNSTGLTSISLTGPTKFGMRFSGDRTGTQTGWTAGVRNQVYPYSGDNATNKPKLVVTYTLPGGTASRLTLLGVGR